MKKLSQDSHSSGRDLNPGLTEYEAGVLTNEKRHSAKSKFRHLSNILIKNCFHCLIEES
jgi:hypothetical protein